VREEDGIIRLEYRDDGPGYPEAVLEENGGGVGMHLLQQLVCGTLRGMLSLFNEDGAVAVLCIKTEDSRQT
jgi:two-component sensor histidine kinase